MDDLKMLRDLGRDLEHDPPASLIRQHDRMYGPRRRGLARPRNWLILGVATAVTASALLVPGLLLPRVGPMSDLVDIKTDPLKKPGSAEDMNILVLGADSRAGRKGSARSDTIVVAHIPADGRDVRMVSIPRDTLVDVPDCTGPDGETVPGGRTMINQAFSAGGAECTRKTVEKLAGITLAHTVVFDFEAFRKAVDVLGGVRVTVKADVSDPKARLRLSRGTHVLNGEQALAYARARYGFGDGSDLGRIERQQQVMAAIVEKAEPVLGDPVKVLELVQAVAPALETDGRLTAGSMVGILAALGDAKGRTVSFQVVPWRPAPEDPNRLVLKQPEAGRLWQSLR